MSTFTLVHVAISLVGIGSGLVVLSGLLASRRLDGWTALFLASTVLTSLTGFGFPFEHFLPSHAVGLLSLVLLTVAIVARYAGRLAGAWRSIYVVTAVAALYFNVFVLVVQLFLKVPALRAMAPTQTEPPLRHCSGQRSRALRPPQLLCGQAIQEPAFRQFLAARSPVVRARQPLG